MRLFIKPRQLSLADTPRMRDVGPQNTV
jgi:hypothetical protein